jgi:hypothetical protein
LLDQIKEFATPVIVLNWDDDELKKELEINGISVYYLPKKKIGLNYYRTKQQLSVWHFNNIKSPTTQIDKNRLDLLKPRNRKIIGDVKQFIYSSITNFHPYLNYLLDLERKHLVEDTNIKEYQSLVKKIKPDLVFCLTPYFQEEEFLLRAAEIESIPLITSIISFDNLTTRGWISTKFEEYYLWNKYNESELKRIYPETTNKPIKIVGAPQFDFYYDDNYLWPESEWRHSLKIPTDAPVILFGAGPINITPHEPLILQELDKAITDKKIRNDPIILFRRHPVEPIDRWKTILENSKNIIIDEPWKNGKETPGKTNIFLNDIQKLCTTLKYCNVHINTSSTMTIDGAIYDKPQIGPGFSIEKKFKKIAYDLYLREHFLPITNSGGLDIPKSLEECITMINNAFENPKRKQIERKNIIHEIATYDDGKSTMRVASKLREYIERYG